ncbi:MAG: hypothetical protein FWB79_01805 [Treponema sp.]|nr:hypothetical protein [Treponema sp.]
MQTTVTLNCLYADYIAGRLEKKKFEGIIFRAIRKIKFRMPGLGKEDREDFVSWLYPRVSRAIDNYHAIGASFESYINKVVYMSSKEYSRKQIRNSNTELAAWIAQAYSDEREYEYSEAADVQPIAPMGMFENSKNSRKLLLLTLKCSRYVSDDFIERVSSKLGMKAGALSNMVDSLRERKEKREAQMESLREVANRQFCRCLFHERTLQFMKDNPAAARRIKFRLDHCRSKLGKTRKRLSRMQVDPSNAQIAELLGLSKGSVDATLHSLKIRCADVLGGNQSAKSNHMLN